MAAFLSGARGTLRITYRLSDYLGEGSKIEVVVDASPTDVGGFLVEDGTITEYFDDVITQDDERILNANTGDSTGQQVWEALAVLCALRLWADKWSERRIQLRVTGDSVSALTMVVKTQARGEGTALIARELALDVAESLYEPAVCTHIPGVANVLADYLSRRRVKALESVPGPLRAARQRRLPPRDAAWWRTR